MQYRNARIVPEWSRSFKCSYFELKLKKKGFEYLKEIIPTTWHYKMENNDLFVGTKNKPFIFHILHLRNGMEAQIITNSLTFMEPAARKPNRFLL